MLRAWPRLAAVTVLRWYQRTLSFDHGVLKYRYPHGFCRFTPTCSEYAIQAIQRYGLVRGGLQSGWRVLRCHPWSKGGVDPVK